MSANPANPFALLGGNRRRIRAELDRVRGLIAVAVGAEEAHELARLGGLVLVRALTMMPWATMDQVAASLRLAAELATRVAEMEAEEAEGVAQATAIVRAIVAGALTRSVS